MHKLCISVAAAALVAVAYPASAQLSTASSRAAEQTNVKPGSMHDHIERAETIVKELLAQRPAGAANPAQAPKNFVNIERPRLEKLQGELNAITTASNDTSQTAAGTLQAHVTTAANMVSGLEAQPTVANSDVITVDRNRLKELRDAIEAIEHSAKESHRESK